LKTLQKISFLFLCLASFSVFAQAARIKGVLMDEKNHAIDGVTVSYQNKSTITDASGFYMLAVPANQKVTLVFTHVALGRITASFLLKPNEDFEYNPVMITNSQQLEDVVITSNKRRVQGIISIDPEVIRTIPGANAGVENILKTFGGVNNNNEMSSGYNVRGGNYDENLVYVNEIEVYRPFLVRSGQQEGLSFTNTDLVQKVDFSAGGFQSKYGDKMASVLDISYRKPTKFGLAAQASFLGGSVAVEGVSKNQKWSYLTGIRYRDNSLLVNSQETQTNFKPSFADVQTSVIFNSSTKWQWNFLGNILKIITITSR
jgi:hypothetical protein